MKCFIWAVANLLPPVWRFSLANRRLTTWDRPSTHRARGNPIRVMTRLTETAMTTAGHHALVISPRVSNLRQRCYRGPTANNGVAPACAAGDAGHWIKKWREIGL